MWNGVQRPDDVLAPHGHRGAHGHLRADTATERSNGDRIRAGPGYRRRIKRQSEFAGSGHRPQSAARPLELVVSQRVAQTGQYVAALLPDDKGVRLIDCLVRSPAPHPHPARAARWWACSETPPAAAGDRSSRSPMTPWPRDRGIAGLGLFRIHGEYQVNLWDPDHLDRPDRQSLRWTPGPVPRVARVGRHVPLVAISPDGKTVAVAATPASGSGSSPRWTAAASRMTGERTEGSGRTDGEMASDLISILRPNCRRWHLGPTPCWRRPAPRPAACVINMEPGQPRSVFRPA